MKELALATFVMITLASTSGGFAAATGTLPEARNTIDSAQFHQPEQQALQFK